MKTNFNYMSKIVLLTFFMLLSSMTLQLIGINIIPQGTHLIVFNIFTIFISYFIVAFFYYKTTKRKIDYKKLFGKASLSKAMIGVATGMGIFLFQQLAYRIFIPTNTTVGSNVKILQSIPVMFMVLSAVVLAPIIEELFFRGFFYEITNERTNPYVYYIGTAALFALLHLQNLDSPIYAIYNLTIVFFSGIIFGLVYRKTNWIGTNIIAHATANGIVIFLLILFG